MQYIQFLILLMAVTMPNTQTLAAQKGKIERLRPGRHTVTGISSRVNGKLILISQKGSRSEWIFYLKSKDLRKLDKVMAFSGLPIAVTGKISNKDLGMRRHILYVEMVQLDKQLPMRHRHRR